MYSGENSFKKQYTFANRQSEANRILKKYPGQIPVIVEKSKTSNLSDIDKKKYLVYYNLTVGQFIYVIRQRMKLKPETAIYIFINHTMPPVGALMSQIYKEQKDLDGFLYVTYSDESTFG